MVEYNRVFLITGEIVDNDSVKRLTDYKFNTWRRLTGFFDGEIAGKIITVEDEVKIFGEYPTFMITCKKIDLAIFVNIETKIIVNNEVVLSEEDRKKGYGFMAHENQLKVAQQLGFKKILLRALGGTDKIFNGNITWGKFGYTMTQVSHAMFEATLLKNRGVKCLQQMFLQEKTEEDKSNNVKFCEVEIPEWMGEFDLTLNSINWRILRIYKRKKERRLDLLGNNIQPFFSK